MRICRKEDYVEQVKNHMLLHCSRRDIRLTLEDLNLYFESGTADGRSEETLCDALGSPAKFTSDLLHDKTVIRLHPVFAVNVLNCLILFALVFWVVRYPDPLLFCVMTAVLPAFLWHSLGGRCLFQVRNDTTGNHRKYIPYFIAAAAIAAAQQIVVALLFNHVRVAYRVILTTHYLSAALILVSLAVLSAAAYKLYKGYYLALGTLAAAVGAIGSSLLYHHILFHFASADVPFSLWMVCILPFAVGIILGILCHSYIKLKKK